MTRHIPIALLCLAELIACDNNPGEGKPKAEVAEPTEPAANPQGEAASTPSAEPSAEDKAGQAAQGETTYSFNQENAKVAFVGAKVTGKHEGSFEKFSGSIKVPGGDLTKGTVSADIDTSSVVADEEKLTKHLRSPDFFNVAEMPKATFVSTAVVAGGADGATHTIKGNLNLHGVEKGISFPAKMAIEGDKITVDAEFVINRKEFGIEYPGMPDDLIKDDVLIKLSVNAASTPQS